MADIKFEITQELGVLSQSQKGWNKELNSVIWNGGTPKYDLRSWSADHTKMSKGITLSKEELSSLKQLLNSIEID